MPLKFLHITPVAFATTKLAPSEKDIFRRNNRFKHMYDIHDAPVFQLTFDLLKDYHILRLKFPKTEKYALGERIEDQLLAALIQITEAGRAKKDYKIPPIEQAIAKIETVVILFRLAHEMK